MSPLASGTVLPCSTDNNSANSSLFLFTNSTNRINTRARPGGFHAAHPFCAATADATAASTSAPPAKATRADTSPVLGLKTSALREETPAARFPSMKCGICLVGAVIIPSSVCVFGSNWQDASSAAGHGGGYGLGGIAQRAL